MKKLKVRATSEMIEMLAKYEDEEERPVFRLEDKVYARWNQLQIEQLNPKDHGRGHFLLTFLWEGVPMMTMRTESSVLFERGDRVEITGMRGEMEVGGGTW